MANPLESVKLKNYQIFRLFCRCPDSCYCLGFVVTCKAASENSLINNMTLPLNTRMLDLSGNSEAFNHSLFNSPLNYLVHLNISSCGIRFVTAAMFSHMMNLMVVDLSWNLLESLPSELFTSQSKLKTLRLSNNLELFRIQSYSFAGLKLDFLDLSQNQIIQIDNNAFATLSSETIYLNKTEISIFSTDLFKGIEHVSLLVTDAIKFCCIKPYFLAEENCIPHENRISSCDDLLRNEVIRPFAWTIGLTSVISNICAFVYRMHDKQRLKLGYGIFVSNLAVSDLLMGVYLIIVTSADVHYRGNYMMNDDLWRKGWFCQLAGVIVTLSSETSVLFICLISIDRLLVVKFPFGEVRMKQRASWVLVSIAWIIGLFISTCPLMIERYFKGEFYSRSSVCLALPLTGDRPAGWLYSVLIFIGLNFVMFVLIAVGQWLILREVTMPKNENISKCRTTRTRELRVARNLLLVAMTDFLCWFPVGVLGKHTYKKKRKKKSIIAP